MAAQSHQTQVSTLQQANLQQLAQAQREAQPIQVTGIVSQVNFTQKKGEPSTFKIRCPNAGKTFDVVYKGYCPVRQGDTIYAICLMDAKQVLHILQHPFVQPSIDKDSIIQCFMKSCKAGYGPCVKLYNALSKISGDEASVIPFLTGIAQLWTDTKNPDIPQMFNGIDADTITKVLSWWHRERNLRRLYLFGLNKKEINASRMTCDEIYQQCMVNPYTIPAIPLDKCDNILKSLNKTPEADNRIKGSIARILWDNVHTKGWTGTPTRILAKQFPSTKDHIEGLRAHYGIVTDLDTAYLKFQHSVETWIADYIITKHLEDPITYDTPLDTDITLEDGRIIHRQSAHFSRELSEDQQRAVQGALDHTICVVTGGAGVGKCLAYDTEILMSNGTIKYVQDIVTGDTLMGPDSQPRSVLSICNGRDILYTIVPEYGASFTCNAPHVLTLQDGNATIFDISLQDYMARDATFQSNCYLFHVGVQYPERTVPIDPYLFGYCLKEAESEYIPEIYKVNSRRVRAALLKGIMAAYDTQPIMHDKVQVLKDIEYVANTLGYIVDHNSGTLIIRKGVPLKFTVHKLGVGTYYGFQLSGDGRFLLGDCLVTHNTTCLGQIIHNDELRGISHAVCSFTGKAVARIREVTKKRSPSTLHRLISNGRKYQRHIKNKQFEKQSEDFNEYDHIIIDEASMVTIELLYDFLQAYPGIKRLTFLGDVNQLPPIGWGSSLKQILKSETIPTYVLTTNYRVFTEDGQRDGIILNANAIVAHDENYPFHFVPTMNFTLTEGPIERVYDVIKSCRSYGVKADQLVVVTPYNRCLESINKTFQEIYNMGSRFIIDSRGLKWMIGDRVMLTENDAEIGVFNGETGSILDITPKAILIDFGQSGCHEFLLEPSVEKAEAKWGTSSYYKRGQKMDEVMEGDPDDPDERTVKKLIHAYALTIDKSQGSEWDYVILFIPEFNTGSFINKNRIYTAITRTKKATWVIVSDIEALSIAAVKLPAYRCENLSKRLMQKLPNLQPFKIAPVGRPEMNGDMPIERAPVEEGYEFDDF